MQLSVKKREERNNKKIRREGMIPAILYSQGNVGEEICVNGNEFKKVLNITPTGTLSSKVFELDLGGKKRRAIVKDIQYHVTTYNILHLDFEELFDDVPVTLNIPVCCTYAVDCAGVKLGGVLRQVVRKMRVKTLPRNIPDRFEINVKDMQLGESKRLSEIAIPEGVKPIDNLNNVAVLVARK